MELYFYFIIALVLILAIVILPLVLIIYLCRALSALTSMLQTLDAWLLGRS